MIFLICLFGFLILCCCVESGHTLGSDESESLGTQYCHGQYRVLYPDGQLSQPFNLSTARSYASMFDGQVVSRNFRRISCCERKED